MGNKPSHSNIFDDIGNSLKNNHTLQWITDPASKIEKVASTVHDDAKAVVSYGGTHMVQDVDALTGTVANIGGGIANVGNNIPLIIGGAIVLVILMNKN